jgi:cation diffusion facilitator CzcD-associated flavoprotein CzcO
MHTPWHSVPFDNDIVMKYPMFKTKKAVTKYLAEYSQMYGVTDHIRFGTWAVSVEYDDKTKNWIIETAPSSGTGSSPSSKTGSEGVIRCKRLAICTGYCATSHLPHIKDMDKYKGDIKHTWGVKNCSDQRKKQVLVVGTGNSAMEVLVDAVLSGAEVSLLVNAPRYFISRNMMKLYYALEHILGVYILGVGTVGEQVADIHAVPFESEEWNEIQLRDDAFYQKMSTDLSPYGIPKPSPLQRGESASERRAVFDIGASDFIKMGKVRILTGKIESFDERGVNIKASPDIPPLSPATAPSASGASSANNALSSASRHYNFDTVIFGTVSKLSCVIMSDIMAHQLHIRVHS